MAVRKKFNKSLYDLVDKDSKDAIVKLLKRQGHTIIRTKENMNVDILSELDGLEYYNEVEVKLSWTGDWPEHWEEVRIPERKTRLINKYSEESGELVFYVLRKDYKQAWKIDSTQLTKSRLKEAKGRGIMKGELFYHVPYRELELVDL